VAAQDSCFPALASNTCSSIDFIKTLKNIFFKIFFSHEFFSPFHFFNDLSPDVFNEGEEEFTQTLFLSSGLRCYKYFLPVEFRDKDVFTLAKFFNLNFCDFVV
jgi:hypothetical protein